jgi:hypothetical protein
MASKHLDIIMRACVGGPEIDAAISAVVPQAPDEPWSTDVDRAIELVRQLCPGDYLIRTSNGAYYLRREDEFEVLSGPPEIPAREFERRGEALMIIQAAFDRLLASRRRGLSHD